MHDDVKLMAITIKAEIYTPHRPGSNINYLQPRRFTEKGVPKTIIDSILRAI